MEVNSIILNTRYPKGGGIMRRDKDKYKISHKRHNIINNENNNDTISTTIKSISDGRASFKGGVPLLHRAANFASDNPLVAEALFAILITCGLRPASIMATAKTDDDKEKCSYQAAKSVSSGLIGLAMTALVGTPIALATKAANEKKAFDMPVDLRNNSLNIVRDGIEALEQISLKIQDNPAYSSFQNQIVNLTKDGHINLSVFQKSEKNAEKKFKSFIKEVAPELSDKVFNALKQQKIIDNYARTGKNVADKILQPIFMPIRASITIALVPVLLGLLGKKKPNSSNQIDPNFYKSINFNIFNNKENNLFQSFAGVAENENK